MAHIRHHIFFFLVMFCFIMFLAEISHAVNYTVTNTAASTPGGFRFSTAIGEDYSLQLLDSETNAIWSIFEQYLGDRKDVQLVALFIDDMDGVAYTINNEIHMSARYIQGYSGDVKTEFTGLIYHELTRVWQWNGNETGNTNVGLLDGIADYVRLKTGYLRTDNLGQGDRWDEGFDVTARFLDYCNSLRDGFVAELNKKMRNDYSDTYFVDLLGKNVGQLWADYKAKYQTNY